MKYIAKINKRVSYVRVYTVVKKLGRNENFLTSLFIKALNIKIFNRKQEAEQAAG